MRRSVLLAFAAALALSPMAVAQTARQTPASAPAPAAGAGTAEDRIRDDARHAAETLAFARVAPGQKVADMIMGGGYFTRLFSAAVGAEGHVTAWQRPVSSPWGGPCGEPPAGPNALPNIEAVRSPIGAPEFPAGLDLVFTAQNYHDLHMGVFPGDTAEKANGGVFQALNPGGLYAIMDHHAAAGAGLAAADSLHRIDVEAVKREVQAAGFVLDGESEVLARTGDPMTANVFDTSIRGRTSQFMLRFRKPD